MNNQIEFPSAQDPLLDAASLLALMEVMEWERTHPGKDSCERAQAEHSLRERFHKLFTEFHSALRTQNDYLFAEVAHLRNIDADRLFLEIPRAE
jgi:hypothetical protein